MKETKLCSLCKETKTLNKFYKDRHNNTGRSSRCKDCSKKESKRWYRDSEKYRQIIRNAGLKNRFGITQDDYFELLELQNKVCAICKQKGEQQYLHVDHNHITGEIRGLLCNRCNHGLGNFRDNTEYLEEAVRYISDRKIPSK